MAAIQIHEAWHAFMTSPQPATAQLLLSAARDAYEHNDITDIAFDIVLTAVDGYLAEGGTLKC